PIISTNGRLEIGSYALIADGVVIADSGMGVPWGAPITPPRSDSTPVIIEENVWIGTRAIILPGARIREGAIIGASTVVGFEVPDFAIVAGNPARVVGSAKPR